jgi:hypothetical protein
MTEHHGHELPPTSKSVGFLDETKFNMPQAKEASPTGRLASARIACAPQITAQFPAKRIQTKGEEREG